MLQESTTIISLAEEGPAAAAQRFMAAESTATDSRWVIILGGGSGDRMTPTIREWLGEERPKQYCVFVGSRSMLQHTIDRARQIVPANRIVHVIGAGQRQFFNQAVLEPYASCVIEQPANRGSAAGVFLAASHIYEADPNATVLILPCDLFVYPEARFIQYARRLIQLAEQIDRRMLLMGATPTNAETDYGWIIPETVNGRAVARAPKGLHHGVRRLHEKPSMRDAVRYFQQGCLWNTMVCAANIRTLWCMGRQHLPEMLDEFDGYRFTLRARVRRIQTPLHLQETLENVYGSIAPADFTYDFLQRVAPASRVMPAADMDCCDWGRPERIIESLRKLGLEPTFAAASLNVCNG